MKARLAIVLMLAAVAAGAASAGPKPPAGKKVVLKQTYPAGDYLQTISMNMEQLAHLGERQMDQKSSMYFEIAAHVGKPDAAGNKTMTLKYTRIKQSIQMMGQTISYDSASDQPQDPNMAKGFAPLLKVKIVMTIGADNKIKDVRGLDAMWDELVKADPAAARRVASMRKQMGDEALKGMVEQFGGYLPGKAVAVGETWDIAGSMQAPILGKLTVSSKCKLKAVEKGPAGDVAVIDITASIDTKEPQTAQMGPVKMTVSKFKVDTVGQNKVNLANSMLSSATLTQTGSMAMSVSAPDAAGGGESMVTNFKTTTVMVSKKAPKPVTTKPADK